MFSRRGIDTLSVIRGIGARAAATAALRRTLSTARSAWRRAEPLVRPRLLATSDPFVRALRVAPSPLAEGDDASRLETLERERPGAARAIHERARAAAARIEELGELRVGAGDDPRLAWAPHRLARLVHVAAGARCATDRIEKLELRAAFERGLAAWIEANPPSDEGAWESPLEVALRAWNLWIALALLGPVELSDRTAARAAATLVEHGRSIERRLEDRGLVVGSHLVGELVGLYACGAALDRSGQEAERWRRIARVGLVREARRQVLGDGGGAEASTGYAAFVCELWLAAIVTARAVGEPPEAPIVAAASSMLAHLATALAPDGRGLGIGDDDDSAVLPPAQRAPRDVSPLLPLAVALCGAPTRPGGVPWSEEAAWLAGAPGWRRWRAAPERSWAPSFALVHFGVAGGRVGGAGGDLVVLRAGGHGRAAGGHAHNDPLAIGVWFDGRPVVIDPGTGVYLGRRAIRDRFRGVAAHATVCVDGLEPSPLLETRPFALPDGARARLVASGESATDWWCRARHDGYRRVGVRCEREVRLVRPASRVVVTDRLEPVGGDDREHDVVLSFPVAAPAVIVGDLVRVGSADRPLAWLGGGTPGFVWRVEPTPVSPAYGAVGRGCTVRLVGRARAPLTLVTVIAKRRDNP